MLQWFSSKVKSKSSSSTASTDLKKDGQSPALDNARTIFQLASNLGSGTLNVPGLQAAGLIGVQIVDIVKKARSNKEDAEDLVTRISGLMEPILDALQNRSARDIDPGLKVDIERFQKDLDKIRVILHEQNERGRFSRAVNVVGDSDNIRKCKELIDHSFKRFQIYTFISLRLYAADLRDTEGQAAPIKPNYLPSQPVAPEIFFGRKDTVGKIVRLLDRDTTCRIALVGTGGIGKSSAGLHIFHHPDIVHRFKLHRYFVACDAITTSDSLATMILQVMGAQIVNSENLNTTLHRVLMTLPPALVFLDNFETPWDLESSRPGVEDLFSKIGATPKISLMVTTRIKELPNNLSWTYEAEIAPLSPEAARQAYLAIDTSREDMDVGSMKILDELLKELDHVPLAIRLLATVGKGYSPVYLLRQWKEERTELLNLRKDRQGSIAVSISLSLSQLRITSNPEALQLLGVLSLLPDGLSCWTERISQIGPGFTRVHRLARVLLQTSLCFLDGETLKVLSPIRHYVLTNYSAATAYVGDLEGHYWDLIRYHALTDVGPEFLEARKVLDPEMGNILGLLRNAIQYHPSLDVVEATIELSLYFSNTIPSTQLLMEIKEQSECHGDTSTEARRLEVLGKNMSRQARYIKASECFKEAGEKFTQIGDALGASRCSRDLGEAFYLQGNHVEATAILSEAQAKFIEIGNVLGATQCSRRLGNILRMHHRLSEATTVLKEARDKFIEIGNVLGAAQCSQNLGDILQMQNRNEEATDILTKARDNFIEIGSVLGAAQCSHSLGDLLCMQGRNEEATALLLEAQTKFIEIGNDLGSARCSKSLGDILYTQGRNGEATALLVEARTMFIEIGDILGTSQCLRTLGRIRSCASEYAEASKLLSEAREQLLKAGHRLCAAQSLQFLADNLRFEGKYVEAKELLIKARDEFSEIGNPSGIEQCKFILGEIAVASNSDETSSNKAYDGS